MTSARSQKKLIVQKYGGATLATPEKIKQVAKRIADLQKTGCQIVVVVSAMGQSTNQLIDLAHQVSSRPLLRELDMLLTTGERVSMSLLSMALNDLGCAAISFTGSQAGILTDDSHVSANIIDVKAFRVQEALKENKVVILAGFQGVSQQTKEITTLGRGGSDISAVAMAAALQADRCEILKDVDSVYSADPKLVSTAQAIHNLNYSHLLEMTSWGAKVLHYRSVALAAEKNVHLFIGSAADTTQEGTTVSTQNKFSQQKVLAINSFSQVFALNLKDKNFDSLQEHLQNEQVGQVQLLSQNNFCYITAPHEILETLRELKNQTGFEILNTELCSVSATYSHKVNVELLKKITSALIDKKIEITQSLTTDYSLHFILNQTQKNLCIESLHQLISA